MVPSDIGEKYGGTSPVGLGFASDPEHSRLIY